MTRLGFAWSIKDATRSGHIPKIVPVTNCGWGWTMIRIDQWLESTVAGCQLVTLTGHAKMVMACLWMDCSRAIDKQSLFSVFGMAYKVRPRVLSQWIFRKPPKKHRRTSWNYKLIFITPKKNILKLVIFPHKATSNGQAMAASTYRTSRWTTFWMRPSRPLAQCGVMPRGSQGSGWSPMNKLQGWISI